MIRLESGEWVPEIHPATKRHYAWISHDEVHLCRKLNGEANREPITVKIFGGPIDGKVFLMLPPKSK